MNFRPGSGRTALLVRAMREEHQGILAHVELPEVPMKFAERHVRVGHEGRDE